MGVLNYLLIYGYKITENSYRIMSALTNIWKNYTVEFSTTQKVIIAIVLGMIFLIALMAIVLVIMEIAN